MRTSLPSCTTPAGHRPRRKTWLPTAMTSLAALAILVAPAVNPPNAQAAPGVAAAPADAIAKTLKPAQRLPAGQLPPMMLAQTTATDRNALPLPITRYWVSEKYDGLRAWWDGDSLRTRQGHRIAAPAWFTAGWPPVAMDGELWAGRGRFEFASSTVQSLQPDDAAWRQLRFMVFDLPEQPLHFTQRWQAMRALQQSHTRAARPTWDVVPQWQIRDFAELQTQLRQRAAQGAEGLMLHEGEALHVVGRSQALIKFKPLDDAEAVVTAHLPGQGKHAGRLGALEVRNDAGQVFRIGTGFTDRERESPPPVGTRITYTHQGSTAKGLPRFARYLRVRSDGATKP